MEIEEHFPDEDKRDERAVMAAMDVIITLLQWQIEKGLEEGRYTITDGVIHLTREEADDHQ